MRVNIPDAQHAHLDAIMDEVYRLESEGVDLSWAHEEAPQSHVFAGEDTWDLDPDPEECMSIIMEVGSRDLDDKIRYWTRILTDLREEYSEESVSS